MTEAKLLDIMTEMKHEILEEVKKSVWNEVSRKINEQITDIVKRNAKVIWSGVLTMICTVAVAGWKANDFLRDQEVNKLTTEKKIDAAQQDIDSLTKALTALQEDRQRNTALWNEWRADVNKVLAKVSTDLDWIKKKY